MPWCDNCSAYRAPSSLATDATCTECGEPVDVNDPQHTHGEPSSGGTPAPWHFWLLVIALAAYLIWRLIQGVLWVM